MMSITKSESISESITKTHSINLNIGIPIKIVHIGGGYGYSKSKTHSETKSDQTTGGLNWGVSTSFSKGETHTYKSYTISDLLDKAEKTIDRISHSQATGLWKYATYVFAGDSKTSINIASFLNALTQGKESYLEASIIQEWARKKATDGKTDFDEIREYVHNFTHPVFYPQNGVVEIDEEKHYEMMVTPTSYVSTDELSNVITFPRKSVAGLPVLECAEFGRNIVTYDQVHTDSSENSLEQDKKENKTTFSLGTVFHMNQEEKMKVQLLKKSLASHTFVTGSTGSGKSNTVYQLLIEAMRQQKKVRFLVIEPAKGEYKHVFSKGSRIWDGFNDTKKEDFAVNVYGTNPYKSVLLRLNPFSFPIDVHVLEHIDRLVEIFNVCWPMYAAMPAVLKSAIEKAYEDCGWNLTESTNIYATDLYPCFADVARNIKTIIDTSEYDAENKGAYKGSLLTRLQSLTNGINGMIFSQEEVKTEDLFERNVIVDLSRVGSTETKSLLMGILVLKLQEYRMSINGMVSDLEHITVLEEAHHLLKRTSTEQTTESGNLVGKSVEMISNAIAEMRSKGEGFIIADQAPGLLDMAVIRNTNTKIILRLPDQTDRELVGKSAGLNDDQIMEIAKLPTGVAAVHQNDWIQAVLCKVEEVKLDETLFEYMPDENTQSEYNIEQRHKIAKYLSNGTKLKKEVIIREIIPVLKTLKLSSFTQVRIAKHLESPPEEPRKTKLAPIFCELYPEVRKAVIEKYEESPIASEWTHAARMALNGLKITSHTIGGQIWRDIVLASITDVIINERKNMTDFERWRKEGGILT